MSIALACTTADQARVIAARHRSAGREVATVRTVTGLVVLVTTRNAQ